MHVFPKSLINSTKSGTEKDFASQWLSISPNSMISFKFYVQTPFFSTFITLHLGKGHIQTVNRHSAPDGASATASLFSGVDSNGIVICAVMQNKRIKILTEAGENFKVIIILGEDCGGFECYVEVRSFLCKPQIYPSILFIVHLFDENTNYVYPKTVR